MNETAGQTPSEQPAAPKAEKAKKGGRGFLWSFIAVVLAFGAGAGWQYYEGMQIQLELEATRQELTVERLRVRLSQAALAAQAADFEAARRGMSDLFNRLTELEGSLPESVAGLTDSFLAQRDDIITGLSRSNPEYARVLYDMLVRFRNAAGLEEAMEPIPVPVEPMDATEPEMDGMEGDSAGA